MTGPKTACATLALLLAAATSGCATGAGGYEESGANLSLYDTWDADRNGMLDENEFDLGASRWPGDFDVADFTAWDTDRNGLVSEDEFYGGAYDVWDVDNDGMLSEAEFDAGATGLGEAEIGGFADWDVDDNGVLDDEEFYEGRGA
jgi:hypothetical protein